MAEFASAIVGLLVAGAKVGDTLHTLIDTFKDAPNEFLALSNEITDFQLVLSKVAEARELGELSVEDSRPNSGFDIVLKRGKEILQEVERLAQEVVKQQQGKGEGTQVNRIKWLRRVKKARKLQNGLQAQKSSLCSLMIVGSLKSSARIGATLDEMRVSLNYISGTQIPQIAKLDTMSSRVARTRDMMEQIVDDTKCTEEFGNTMRFGGSFSARRQEKNEDSLPPLVYQLDKGPRELESGIVAAEPHIKNTSELAVYGRFSVASLHSETQQVRSPRLRASFKVASLEPLGCLKDCACRCHHRAIIRSPRNVSNYLGDFLFGVSNLPWYFSSLVQCNEQTCRRSRGSTADLKYFLPSWFTGAVASFSVSFSLRMFPLNVCVQSRQTIPYDSPILVCVQEGDTNGIRSLLRAGRASLNDVDPYGLGLLYYATYYCWRGSGREVAIETCRLLLDMGAHADWEDEIGNTPMETMIDDTLMTFDSHRSVSQLHTPSDFEYIAQLFGKSSYDLLADYTSDRDFTTLHEVLLGIDTSEGTLENYLASFGEHKLPSEVIDAHDSCGRTTLAWAVEYGCADAVKMLLKYGANPHQLRPSVHGKSPLLHLVIAGPASQRSDAGFLDVVKLLLQAGVDVNAVDHEGWTPLHVAASWNLYSVIKELAHYGADSLNWTALTDDNQSALELSLGAGVNEEVQQLLLKHASCGEDSLNGEKNIRISDGSIQDFAEDPSNSVDDEVESLEEFSETKEHF